MSDTLSHCPPARDLTLSQRWLMGMMVAATLFAGMHAAAISYVVMVMGFLLIFMWRDRNGKFVRPDRVTTIFLTALFIDAAISVQWTTDPARAMYDLVVLLILGIVSLQISAGTARMAPAVAEKLLRWFVAAYFFTILCVALDICFNVAVQRAFLRLSWLVYLDKSAADRGCFVGLLLLWPVISYCWQQRWRIPAVGLWLLVGILMLFSNTAAGRLAFAVSTLAAAVACVSPRAMRMIYAVVIVTGMVIAVPVAQVAQGYAMDHFHHINSSFAQRLEIWEFTAKRFLEKPWLGWGFDSARAIPNMGEHSRYLYPTDSIIPMHPHDWFLHVLLELGVIGAGLMAALWLWWLSQTANLSRAVQPAALASYAVVIVIGAFSIGIWQSWWLSALVLVSIVVQLLSRQAERSNCLANPA